jgi:hypothetical protein
MKHRNRNALAAVLAAGLLVISALGSTALAHGGPGFNPGGGWHDPGSTPKVHSTGAPTLKAKLTHDPSGPGWKLPVKVDCTKPPTPVGSPAPTPVSTGDSAVTKGEAKFAGAFGFVTWKIATGWGRAVDATVQAQICSVPTLKTAADKKIASQLKSLANLLVRVGKIPGLSTGDQSILTGEINGLVGDFNALKLKVDAETTLAGLQADVVTLSKDSVYARSIGLQVSLLGVAESAIAAGPTFATLETTLAGKIAAAPSTIDTAQALTLLADMKTKVAAAEALAGPLPALLLALTPTQLQAGKGDPTIAKARADLWQASFDLWKARHDDRMIEWILAGKPDSDKDADKSPAPSVSPVPTSAPTATPV